MLMYSVQPARLQVQVQLDISRTALLTNMGWSSRRFALQMSKCSLRSRMALEPSRSLEAFRTWPKQRSREQKAPAYPPNPAAHPQGETPDYEGAGDSRAAEGREGRKGRKGEKGGGPGDEGSASGKGSASPSTGRGLPLMIMMMTMM